MRIVVCGIGNRGRGDDFFGPYIIDNVQETEKIKKIDCGLYPENFLNRILSLVPDLVIFLDTIKKNSIGGILLRNEELIERSPISASTHNLPFSAFYQYLKENGVHEVFFLGVPAFSYEEFTGHMKDTADRLAAVINNIDKQNIFDILTIYEILSEQIR